MEVFMLLWIMIYSGWYCYNYGDEIIWELVLNLLGMISFVIDKEVD